MTQKRRFEACPRANCRGAGNFRGGARAPLSAFALAFTLAFALLPLCAGAAFGKETLAVLPFAGGAGDEGEAAADLFAFDPELDSAFTLIPRANIEGTMRRELRLLQVSGLADPDSLTDIGRRIGARYVLAGNIVRLEDRRLLILALLDTSTREEAGGEILTYRRPEELSGLLTGAVKTLTSLTGTDRSDLPQLALAPFDLRINGEVGDALAPIMGVRMLQTGAYRVYPRSVSVERLKEEYKGRKSNEEAPRFALAGSARRFGSTLTMFNSTIIDLESGAQTAGASANFERPEEGAAAMELLAAKMFGIPVVSSTVTFKTEADSINADDDGDYSIVLGGDFTLSNITFEGGTKTITISGRGGPRTITNTENAPLFTVPRGITLVFENGVTLNGNGALGSLVRLEGGKLEMREGSLLQGAGESAVYVASGVFTMKGGSITGSVESAAGGGGVYVASSGGTFAMSGGTISGNSAAGPGGGVMIRDGVFNMSGGAIAGNSSGSLDGAVAGGGGVAVLDGRFTMTGGAIAGNVANYGGQGGGVLVSGGSFTMSAGVITGNLATKEGGGVGVRDGGRFTKSGGAIDDANIARAGGSIVYAVSSRGALKRERGAGASDSLDSRQEGSRGGWD